MLADLAVPFGLSIYRYGFPEPEARLIERLLRPGDGFIDGGANVGVFTLIGAASVTESGFVVACEPVPGTMEILRNNITLNSFSWVETRLVALSDRQGSRRLIEFGPGSALSSFAPDLQQDGHAIPVETASLDEVAGSLLDRVRLVKLDIEGAEVLALRGAKRLLARQVDFVVEVEPTHLGRQGTSVDEMKAIFDAAGYTWYEIHEVSNKLSLTRLDHWKRSSGSPNIFVSARVPGDFPPGVIINA